mmetsp:Transcript_3641/g.9175  ORF Transcript_3641/g.9175 Transcript_3641/m.9175 type:complete len:187 (+) Transcript_3641:1-561(+)
MAHGFAESAQLAANLSAAVAKAADAAADALAATLSTSEGGQERPAVQPLDAGRYAQGAHPPPRPVSATPAPQQQRAPPSSRPGSVQLGASEGMGGVAGVGMQLHYAKDGGEARHVVEYLVPGGPAAESGEVEVGDVVLSVGGTAAGPLPSLRNLIAGPPGSSLVLSLGKPGGKQVEVTLTRRAISR